MQGPSLLLAVVVVAAASGPVAATPTLHASNRATNGTGGFQAGLLYVSPEGGLCMPPGSVLIVTPTLSLPLSLDYPLAFSSSATMSLPFSVRFDELGLTSEANSWGLQNRVTRQAPTEGNLAGGDREVIYRAAENSIQSVELDGRACLLRTICEINLKEPLLNLGLFGEVVHLLLSPTKSPRPLGEYTEAEESAKSAGDCSRYYEDCPYSFFQDQDPATGATNEGGFQSGLLYVTPEGRLTMPLSSALIMTPTLSLPYGRDYPLGFGSSATISVPFKVDFDELGMTSAANSGTLLNRATRQAPAEGNPAGGDREVVFRVAENTLKSAGLDGRACLLRAICEIKLEGLPPSLGLFGEVLQMLLSPNRSPRSLGEYTAAEESARTTGDCSQYHEDCPYSFLKPCQDQ